MQHSSCCIAVRLGWPAVGQIPKRARPQPAGGVKHSLAALQHQWLPASLSQAHCSVTHICNLWTEVWLAATNLCR